MRRLFLLCAFLLVLCLGGKYMERNAELDSMQRIHQLWELGITGVPDRHFHTFMDKKCPLSEHHHSSTYIPNKWRLEDPLPLWYTHPLKLSISGNCSWEESPCKYLLIQASLALTFQVMYCLQCLKIFLSSSVLIHCGQVHNFLHILLNGWSGYNGFKFKKKLSFLGRMDAFKSFEDIQLEISFLRKEVWRNKSNKSSWHCLKDWWHNDSSSLNSSTKPDCENWVLPLISGKPYFARLASFRAMGSQSLAISSIQLAEAGYRFSDGNAMCDGCNNVVPLRDFMSHPSESRYHKTLQCPFVQEEQEADKDDRNSPDPISHSQEPARSDSLEEKHSFKDSGNASEPDDEQENPFPQTDPVSHQDEYEDSTETFISDSVPSVVHADTSGPGETDLCSTIYETIQPPQISFTTVVGGSNKRQKLWKRALAPVSVVARWKRIRAYSSSSSDSGMSSSSGESSGPDLDQYLELDESKYFTQEIGSVDKRSACRDIRKIDCKKSKDHYGYFPMYCLKLDHLHPDVRSKESLDFVKKLGQLVVRIVVKSISPRRPQEDVTQLEMKKIVGTGMILLDDFGLGEEKHTPAGAALQRLSAFLENGKGRIKQAIYIQTSCHVVFDDKEAASSTVELFFDNVDRHSVVSVKGFKVVHSGVLGDSHSILVCKTGDKTLLNSISTLKTEFLNLEGKLPAYLKSKLTKKMLIVSHSHGAPSALSHGDSILFKYALKTPKDSTSKPQLIKQGIIVAPEVKELYKVLMYTANTCVGCTGAPAISYKNLGKDSSGVDMFKMQLWMHHGADKDHNLSVSAMQVCTPQEIEEFKKPPPKNPEDEEEQQAAQPPPKTKNVVMHSQFVDYSKRLASLKDWPSSNVHKATVLAFAGFFYAGYRDCVRCFYCGIGLKSWKSGDSIFGEHKKHRPSCMFLLTLFQQFGEEELISGKHPKLLELESEVVSYEMYAPGPSNLVQEKSRFEAEGATESTETHVYENTNSSLIPYKEASNEQLLLHLARSEHQHLQNVFLCKICHQYPVKELLLPCGHLCSCGDCCKMLSHCPVCETTIVATVDTYFS